MNIIYPIQNSSTFKAIQSRIIIIHAISFVLLTFYIFFAIDLRERSVGAFMCKKQIKHRSKKDWWA